MVRNEWRIMLAALAVFVSLAGVAVSIHGLLYDKTDVVLYGMIAAGVGIVVCVGMLTICPKDVGPPRHRES